MIFYFSTDDSDETIAECVQQKGIDMPLWPDLKELLLRDQGIFDEEELVATKYYKVTIEKI